MTAITIERFPTFAARAPRNPARSLATWVAVGSEYDLNHITRLWQLVMRYELQDLPDDETVMWQLADALCGRRADTVKIIDGKVFVDRGHMADFRHGLEWLDEHIEKEHGDHVYTNRGTRWRPNWQRIHTDRPPVMQHEDAQRARLIINALWDVVVDNVVKLREDA